MNPQYSPDPWSYFDIIYCINLRERPDRRAQAEAQFARVGLGGRVTFITAERHLSDCEQGIYESHLACIRQGLAEQARRWLIFEDDVLFERYHPARWAAAIDFLEGHPDWQLLFLGCLVKHSRATPTPEVRKVAYRCLSHAYALNRPTAELLARHSWDGTPYDKLLSRLSRYQYACYPTFAFQSDSASDNARRQRLDRFRRWCGGLRRIQKMDEWYHRHAAALVAAHLIGLGVLLWMTL
jgi:hypothetical protein